jgi:hypothetical protein
MMMGHGKMREYLHRFKILDDATCICRQRDQTTDHLLYHCAMLHTQRGIIKQNILKTGNWPVCKQELITNYSD